MNDNDIIRTININNGVQIYTSEDIFKNKSLYNFIVNNMVKLPSSLFQDIINENGVKLVLKTNESITLLNGFHLEGASLDLQDKFLQRYS